MKQTTAKTVEQALIWIDSHPHHIIQAYPSYGSPIYIEVIGWRGKLRVPDRLRLAVWGKIEPNPRPFDTRMFRVTKWGREWLREQMHKAAHDAAMEAVTQYREKYPEVTAMQLGTVAHRTIFEQLVVDGEVKVESTPISFLAHDRSIL